MNSERKRFYIPFVGQEYKTGINGKKILVVGASFYCNIHDCEFFSECTNPDKKDSSHFNSICPPYKKTNSELKQTARYAIVEDDYTSYQTYLNFAECLQPYVEEGVNVWERVAFTNYVQFFIPTVTTHKKYLSERDFEAFKETVLELKPDLIITWGMAILDPLRDNNKYVIDREKLAETDWYICHLEMPGVDHLITFLHSYHPSSSAWHQDIDYFTKYLEQALEIK